MVVRINMDGEAMFMEIQNAGASYLEIPYNSNEYIVDGAILEGTVTETIKFLLVPIIDGSSLAVCVEKDLEKFKNFKKQFKEKQRQKRKLDNEGL